MRASSLFVLALLAIGCDKKAPPPDAAAPADAAASADAATTAIADTAMTGDAGNVAASDAGDAKPERVKATPPEKVTSVEGITEYVLGNGLRVLLFPDPSKPTVTVNITYMVGSRHEGYGETGMAHLLEHMMFKGTPTHKEIWVEMQKRGAQFNGTTDYDRTNYYETVTASDDNIAWALELEADRMVHSLIAPEALASEFSVVRNEFEMGENDPNGILYERILATAFLWHNYGKSPIGSRSDIERVPATNLHAFYEKYYQPDNAVLVVAGKFDADKMLAQVNERFGVIPKPTRVLPTSWTVEPVQDGEREVTLRRNGDVQVIGVAYHTVAGTDAAYPAAEAIGHVLSNEPSGRLYKALIASGLATKIATIQQPVAEPGWIVFFAVVPADKPLEPVRAAMLAEIEGFKDHPVTDEELTRFKQEHAKNFELLLANSQEAAVRLTDWQALGDWRMMFLNRDRIAALGAQTVTDFGAAYFKRANRTLGTFVPDKAPDRSPMPGRPDVAAQVKGYEGKAQVATGEVVEATVPAIEKATKRSQAGGVKLALLSKQTRGGIVNAQLVLHFGDKTSLKGRVDAGNVVPDLLMRGTTAHDFQALKDELAKLKAEVSIEGSGTVPQPGVVTVHVQTTRENLAAVLALVAEILQKPAFPEDQFAILVGEYKTQIEARLSDPQALAITEAIRKLVPLPPEDVRYMPTVPESLERVKALKLADVKSFWADFYGASNAEMAIVGDFDAAAVEKQVGELFGSWASKAAFERVPGVYIANDKGEAVIDTPDKESGFIMAVQSLPLKDSDPDYPALRMVDFVLGGSGGSRLINRLRQKEGWSYGAFSQVFASPFDEVGILIAGALVNPQNAPKAMAALKEEMALLIEKGVPADELATAQKGWQNQFDTMLGDDQAVADKLVGGLFTGRTLQWDQDQNDAIAKLTPEAIAAVLAKGRIKVSELGTVIASDQKKAKETP